MRNLAPDADLFLSPHSSKKRKGSVIIPPLPPIPTISVPYSQSSTNDDNVFFNFDRNTSHDSPVSNDCDESFSQALQVDPFELNLGCINEMVEDPERRSLSDIQAESKVQLLMIRQDPIDGAWVANISDGEMWVKATINNRYAFYLKPQDGSTPALGENGVIEIIKSTGHPLNNDNIL